MIIANDLVAMKRQLANACYLFSTIAQACCYLLGRS
jgi:hypothetical protein